MKTRPQEAQTSSTVTEGIRIVARSSYLADQSMPAAGRYAFSYEIRIWNEGPHPAQLRARHWTITDSNGKVQEICGPGVVGEEPLLRPGAHFQYTSRAVLETPRGQMRGTYLMQRPNGRVFDAVIAPFLLAQPHSLN